MEYLTTHDGITIPILGLGTWQLSDKNCESVVSTALDLGYRHIDTAAMYHTETAIGKAMEHSDLDRSELFITSKVWTNDLGKKTTMASFDRSLSQLQTDYLDLFLIHWPGNDKRFRLESYDIMMELRDEGKIKAIGVSNFSPVQIDEIYQMYGEYPAVNQILFNPFNYNVRTLDYCNLHKILLTAYTPLNKGSGLNRNEITVLSEKYNKTTAQIVLRWFIDLKIIAIPKSASKTHLQDNINIFDFQLTEEEVASLKNL